MLHLFTILSDYITYKLIGLNPESKIGDAVHFFIEDTTKIYFLIVIMIYLIAIIRASLNLDRVRVLLQGKSRWFGYSAGALFGSITPFCSCSSIPMFLGFTSAGIPTGVTLSFLITSPLLNEVAIVLLGSLMGIRFTVTYIIAGLIVGILGGLFFDAIGAEKLLQPIAERARNSKKVGANSIERGLTIRDRHNFALNELSEIFSRIWKWVKWEYFP